MTDAAYHPPTPPKAKTAAKIIRMILKVLFITHSFYIEPKGMLGPRLKYRSLMAFPCYEQVKPHIAYMKNLETCSNIYKHLSTLKPHEG